MHVFPMKFTKFLRTYANDCFCIFNFLIFYSRCIIPKRNDVQIRNELRVNFIKREDTMTVTMTRITITSSGVAKNLLTDMKLTRLSERDHSVRYVFQGWF